MKRIISYQIVALILVGSSNLYAQSSPWVDNNGSIHYNSGNVGIGVSTPGAKLQVDYITSAGVGSRNGITVNRITHITEDQTRYDKAIYGRLTDYTIPVGVRDAGYKIGVDASAFSRSASSFAGTLRKSIGLWARAGIYESNSMAITENAYAVYAELLTRQGTVNNGYGVFIASPHASGDIIHQYDLFASSPEAKNYFAGTLGVGTANPQEKLQVKGNIYMSETNPYLYFNGNALNIKSKNNAIPLLAIRASNTYNSRLDMYRAGDTDVNIRLNTANGSKSYINTNGRLGINTDDPDEALTVKGTIHSHEVRVDTDANVVPDYVFKDDYQLMSLSDLEKYIDREKHLPEVPSADQIAEEGLMLKEMNLLLLKKVEELTLHLIEMQKENNKQIMEIESLKSKIYE